MKNIKSYDKKIIISNHVIEVFEYGEPILYDYQDFKKTSSGRQSKATEKDSKINREKSISRSKQNLRRLINSNADEASKFVTLTFSDNVIDLDIANREFKKFIQRLNYHTGLKNGVQYVAVIEFQKRGAVHYHVIFFNLPYVKNSDLRLLWGQGWVKVNRIREIDNIGAYVVKYMQKESSDDRLRGRKCYLSSRGLIKPVEIKEDAKVKVLADALTSSQFECYSTSFNIIDDEGNVLNSVTYKQYNIKRDKNILNSECMG